MAYTTIDDPSAHFQIMLFTGDLNDNRALTNDGNSDLQPDLIWFKNRATTNSHNVLDSSRGVGLTFEGTNSDGAEGGTSTRLTSFDSDGFTVRTDPSVNGDGNGIVAWQWKANGGSEVSVSASGSGITDILASSHQANTTAGFSIVKWTGDNSEAYVSHGLGAVPHCYIVKNRDTGTTNWMMYHKETGGDAGMIFNTTAARDVSSFWRNSDAASTGDPTSSIFKLGTQAYTGGNTDAMIAYCWAPIQGYSKFGIYTGNGDDDGAFIYTGFKPAWVITKHVGGSNYWHIHDIKRNPFNVVGKHLMANDPMVEQDPAGGENSRDFLSNGFKFRDADHNNQDGNTHIYMAFAEQPFVTSGGVPCTAH